MKTALVIALLAISQISYSQIDTLTKLVAHYPFSGNTNDASANGNHALSFNTTLTSDRFGNANNALEFDGITSFLLAPNSTSLQSPDTFLTVMAWVYVYASSTFDPILHKGDTVFGLTQEYSLAIDNSPAQQILCSKSISSSATISAGSVTNVSLNEWHHMAISYGDTSIRTYLNGRLIREQAQQYDSFPNNSDPLFIGRSMDDNGSYFKGKLDDIRIYSRGLSEADILVLYKKEVVSISSNESVDVLKIRVFPNPVNDFIQIAGNYEILKIMDSTGQLVFVSRDENKIDLSFLESGLYFIDIDGIGSKIIKK